VVLEPLPPRPSCHGRCASCRHMSSHATVQALAFGRRVDELCRDNEREMLLLEERRKRNLVEAAAVRDDLLRAFGELEAVVHSGRQDILVEQERQQVRLATTHVVSCGAEQPDVAAHPLMPTHTHMRALTRTDRHTQAHTHSPTHPPTHPETRTLDTPALPASRTAAIACSCRHHHAVRAC
jgi:hypothetical protein